VAGLGRVRKPSGLTDAVIWAHLSV
jgi:hypothetical protein